MSSQGTRQKSGSWSLTKWIGNSGSILSLVPCCHSAQCGGWCLDTGLELNPLLPRLGSMQRQLFSPYGGTSAPPPPLSNDTFLTDTPERALDSGGKVNTTQCLLGCRGENRGCPLTKPPCIYVHRVFIFTVFWYWPHYDIHKPNIFH